MVMRGFSTGVCMEILNWLFCWPSSEDPFQDLREFLQDFQRNMPVRSRDFRLGDHPICTNQQEKECRYGWKIIISFGLVGYYFNQTAQKSWFLCSLILEMNKKGIIRSSEEAIRCWPNGGHQIRERRLFSQDQGIDLVYEGKMLVPG